MNCIRPNILGTVTMQHFFQFWEKKQKSCFLIIRFVKFLVYPISIWYWVQGGNHNKSSLQLQRPPVGLIWVLLLGTHIPGRSPARRRHVAMWEATAPSLSHSWISAWAVPARQIGQMPVTDCSHIYPCHGHGWCQKNTHWLLRDCYCARAIYIGKSR